MRIWFLGFLAIFLFSSHSQAELFKLNYCSLKAELSGSEYSFQAGKDILDGLGTITCREHSFDNMFDAPEVSKTFFVVMQSFPNVVYEKEDTITINIHSVGTKTPEQMIERLSYENLENLHILRVENSLSFSTAGRRSFIFGTANMDADLLEPIQITLGSYLHFDFLDEDAADDPGKLSSFFREFME